MTARSVENEILRTLQSLVPTQGGVIGSAETMLEVHHLTGRGRCLQDSSALTCAGRRAERVETR